MARNADGGHFVEEKKFRIYIEMVRSAIESDFWASVIKKIKVVY